METDRKGHNEGLARVEAALEAAGFRHFETTDARVQTAHLNMTYTRWVNPSDGRAVVLQVYRDYENRFCTGFDAFESITTKNSVDALIEGIAGKAGRAAPAIACVDALRQLNDACDTAPGIPQRLEGATPSNDIEVARASATAALADFDADPSNQGANGLDVLAAGRVAPELIEALRDLCNALPEDVSDLPGADAQLFSARVLLKTIEGA